MATDKEMDRKQIGYDNLKLGSGWNKDKGNKEICCICNKEFKRSKSKIKSVRQYCSIECKSEGHKRKYITPRKNTGCSDSLKYYKRKYYKYRCFDKGKGFNTLTCTVWEFVNLLDNGSCYYCGTTENLGLDRVNNNKGHSSDNTIIACDLCNMTRGDRFTVEEMELIGNTIKQVRRQRNVK